MAHQLDIKPAGKRGRELARAPPRRHRPAPRPAAARPAPWPRRRDRSARRSQRRGRRSPPPARPRLRRRDRSGSTKRQKIAVAGLALHQQHDPVGLGSGARRAPFARIVAPPASAISQPMIGCTPASAQAVANSSAPNRLPVSVIATAGIARARQRSTSSLTLIAPADKRIGGVDAQMDKIGERHGDSWMNAGSAASPQTRRSHSLRTSPSESAGPLSQVAAAAMSAICRRQPSPQYRRHDQRFAQAALSQPGFSRPSSRATMRSRRRARSRLWVAISAARPVRADELEQASSMTAVARWRGRDCRSARRRAGSCGSLASARTIATRCCSPPESRAGRCPAALPARPGQKRRRLARAPGRAARRRSSAAA